MTGLWASILLILLLRNITIIARGNKWNLFWLLYMWLWTVYKILGWSELQISEIYSSICLIVRDSNRNRHNYYIGLTSIDISVVYIDRVSPLEAAQNYINPVWIVFIQKKIIYTMSTRIIINTHAWNLDVIVINTIIILNNTWWFSTNLFLD